MTEVPEGMVKIGSRKIMKQGSSHVVAIPRDVRVNAGVGNGDSVDLYTDGKNLLLIYLKPDEEK